MSRRTGAKDETPKRVRWMISRVAESFNLGEAQVSRSFKTDDSKEKLLNFSLPNGPRRILVYYQARFDPLAALEEKGDMISEPDETTHVPGLEAEVFLTFGSSDPLLGKACYFLRMDPTGEKLSMDVLVDENVLFGEFGTLVSVDDVNETNSKNSATATASSEPTPPILSDLQTLIDVLFSKGLRQMKSTAWGPNSKEADVNEILDQVDRLGAELGATIKSRSRVLDLPLPDEEFIDTPRTHAVKETKKNDGRRSPPSSYNNKVGSYESKRLEHYADLLQQWSDIVEADINDIRDTEKKHGENAASGPGKMFVTR